MLRTLMSSIGIIAIFVAVFSIETHGGKVFTTESKRRLMIAEQPQQVSHAVLQTHNSELINWENFYGKYVIVDFIYTRCLTLCRGLGAQFFQIQQQAADLIQEEKLQLLSISFDGARDTPDYLRAYIERFTSDTESWLAARAPDYQDQLLKEFGIVAIADDIGEYTHNASLHLISPSGKLMHIVDYADVKPLIAVLRQSIEKDKMNQRLACDENC